DWVHLVTAMLWVGGVLTLADVVWPLAPDLRRAAFLRFSRMAVFLVGVLLAHGGFPCRGAPRGRDVRGDPASAGALRSLDHLLREDAAREDRARLRRARLGRLPPHVRAAAARAGRDAARRRPQPARRERRRAGRAVRGRGARQRRAAAGGKRLDERGVDAAPLAFGAVLVAISGGAGFLGLHLARRLVADGH